MSTFTPPTDNYVNWALPGERGILAVLRPGRRGRNVFKMNDGSFTEFQPSEQEDIAITYHGGHIHPITEQEEADLIAAGYGDYINFDSIFKYKFSPSTIYSDPGPGIFKFNNSSIFSTTEIQVDLLNADGENVENAKSGLGGKTKLTIKYFKNGIIKYVVFNFLYITNDSGWFHVAGVVYVSGEALTEGQDCYLFFE